MKKYIYNEHNGLWYERQGNYYIPCLSLPEEQVIGLRGQRHLCYIKEYRKALYSSLQQSDRLDSYLADIDQQAQKRFDTIVQQMAQAQGITEVLKSPDPMAWVGQMNNAQAYARKIVDEQIIYTQSHILVLSPFAKLKWLPFRTTCGKISPILGLHDYIDVLLWSET